MAHPDSGVSILAFPPLDQAGFQRSHSLNRPTHSNLVCITNRPHTTWVVKKTSIAPDHSQRNDSIEKVAATHTSKKGKFESLQNVPIEVKFVAAEKCSCAMEDAEAPFAGKEFISGLGLTLEGWVAMGDKQPQALSHFHCVRAPPMGVKAYLKRIHANFQCSDECYVIALIIIDRVGKVDAALTLCNLNVHRLLVTAVMLAAKFHDDIYYTNAYYAQVGGLGLKEMNQLEARMLKLLGWKVNVTAKEYGEYLRIVCDATMPQTTAKPVLLEREPEPEP